MIWFFILWYILGYIGCIMMDKSVEQDTTVGQLIIYIAIALAGPIILIIALFGIYNRNIEDMTTHVVFKRKYRVRT